MKGLLLQLSSVLLGIYLTTFLVPFNIEAFFITIIILFTYYIIKYFKKTTIICNISIDPQTEEITITKVKDNT